MVERQTAAPYNGMHSPTTGSPKEKRYYVDLPSQ